MRSGIVAALLLLGVSAGLSTAQAQDDGYGWRPDPDGIVSDSGLTNYAGLRGSMAFSSSTTAKLPTNPPANLRTGFDTGYGGSVYIGTRLPYGFRLELEGLYRNASMSSVSLGGVTGKATGYSNTFAPMANLMFDFPVPDFPFRPFIGAGLGYAWTQYDLSSVNGIQLSKSLQSDNWHFAYQLMGGLAVPLSQSSRVTAMYRWMHQDVSFDCSTSSAPNARCKPGYDNQSVDLGLEMDL